MEEEEQIIDAMSKYGGSFVKALAEAYRHADPYNRGKIRATWSEYWETYKEMSIKKKFMSEINLNQNRNQYDFIAGMFTSDHRGSSQEKLRVPALQDGYLYSSNGFYACRVDEKLIGGEYQTRGEGNTFPDVKEVFDKKFDQAKPGDWKRWVVTDLIGLMANQDLFLKMDSATLADKCEECEGNGSSECYECGSDKTCENCDGEGTTEVSTAISVVKLLRYKDDTSYGARRNIVQYEGAKIDGHYFGSAILAMSLSGAKKVDIAFVDKKAFPCMLLKNNEGVEILIMGINPGS